MAKPRSLDDLGPDFEIRWKQAPLAHRREFIAELRDLYVMLEQRDEALLARLRRGSIPPLRDHDADLPLLQADPAPAVRQRNLFDEAPPAPARPSKENPFLPRSVLDRLQHNRDRANAGLRDLLQTTADDLRPPAAGPASVPAPGTGFMLAPDAELEPDALHSGDPAPTPAQGSAIQVRQEEMVRELRLRLGPVVESLIEAQMEQIKSELRVRLRFEMDRLIARHLRR